MGRKARDAPNVGRESERVLGNGGLDPRWRGGISHAVNVASFNTGGPDRLRTMATDEFGALDESYQ